ncbi:NADPH-dependent aldehyde reductase Ahr [Desulfopila inferna]|uniref:NADPH-dependent aldehyde reductase Ahr n=1 Tax=Desulfopila inferna TaxID=468528 RepID=UPI001962D00F|nr:NAD(P)-dependent alcohol dehydrogenase [Desulfopila inferna]MBM9605912.1 NAD(P)-dependent alcohol dehydrogenase [Desulfopila inferna]
MIKAYAVHEPKGELKPFEYDPGPLKDDEVEIDVEFCGICHSDISMIDNEWGITQYPLVPGHEVVGTISSAGSKVDHLKIGDVVGLGWQSGYCMTCDSCLSGDHNLCSAAEQTIVAHHGGFADKVRASAASVVKLPDRLDKESAGPLFCGGITVFNPLIQFGIKPTDKVGVIGIGGLGHLALQFLNAWGCEVTAFTSSEEKKKEVLELGAHKAINSRNPSEIESAAGQFDFILSTVNVKLDWNTYLGTLQAKGRLHFVGATLEPLDIAVFPLIMGQRSLSGSPVGSPGNIAKMLNFAAQHNITPVIEKYQFADINEAIARLRSGKAHFRVVLCR